jgi:hypothetical protein
MRFNLLMILPSNHFVFVMLHQQHLLSAQFRTTMYTSNWIFRIFTTTTHQFGLLSHWLIEWWNNGTFFLSFSFFLSFLLWWWNKSDWQKNLLVMIFISLLHSVSLNKYMKYLKNAWRQDSDEKKILCCVKINWEKMEIFVQIQRVFHKWPAVFKLLKKI